MNKLLCKTLAMGTLSGMRAASAPALLSRTLSDSPALALANTPLRFLQNKYVANGLSVLAATETLGDKIPGAPDRIEAPSLVVRAASGTLVGATLYLSNQQKAMEGAVVGAAAAVAATYLSFYLRKALARYTPLSHPVLGALEDALVLGSGIKASKA